MGEGDEELVFNGDRAAVLQGEKGPEDGWWGWLHNNVHILNATELAA